MSTPAGYFSLKGHAPDREGRCDFLVSKHHIERLQRAGPHWKFYNLHAMKEVLEVPAVVFTGLHREGVEHGYCYSGHASKKMQGPGIELPPPPDFVAVVIVCPDHRGNIVLDWEWRREDPDKPGWPQDWQSDFTRPVWTT